MSEKKIEIDLMDESSEGNRTFANIVDARNINTLIARIKDTKEKRSLPELIDEFLKGR